VPHALCVRPGVRPRRLLPDEPSGRSVVAAAGPARVPAHRQRPYPHDQRGRHPDHQEPATRPLHRWRDLEGARRTRDVRVVCAGSARDGFGRRGAFGDSTRSAHRQAHQDRLRRRTRRLDADATLPLATSTTCTRAARSAVALALELGGTPLLTDLAAVGLATVEQQAQKSKDEKKAR